MGFGMRLDLSRLRFLVVEDHAPTRRILCAMLEGFGSQSVAEAEDGEEGLKAFLNHRPDIVITDWDLPLIDGPALTRLLRDETTSPDPFVPVIMLTGRADRRRVNHARAAGVHELLLKPITARALVERVLSVVAAPRPFLRTPTYFGPAPRLGRPVQVAAAPRGQPAAGSNIRESSVPYADDAAAPAIRGRLKRSSGP